MLLLQRKGYLGDHHALGFSVRVPVKTGNLWDGIWPLSSWNSFAEEKTSKLVTVLRGNGIHHLFPLLKCIQFDFRAHWIPDTGCKMSNYSTNLEWKQVLIKWYKLCSDTLIKTYFWRIASSSFKCVSSLKSGTLNCSWYYNTPLFSKSTRALELGKGHV